VDLVKPAEEPHPRRDTLIMSSETHGRRAAAGHHETGPRWADVQVYGTNPRTPNRGDAVDSPENTTHRRLRRNNEWRHEAEGPGTDS
jgi:hypothetical protein